MALELYMKTLIGPSSKVNIVTDNCSSSPRLGFSSSSTCTNDDSTCSASLSAMPLKRHRRSNRMCVSPGGSLEPHESTAVSKREQPQQLIPFHPFSPSWNNDGSLNYRTLESFQTPIESRSRNRRMNRDDLDMSPLIRSETLNHESLDAGAATPRSR